MHSKDKPISSVRPHIPIGYLLEPTWKEGVFKLKCFHGTRVVPDEHYFECQDALRGCFNGVVAFEEIRHELNCRVPISAG